MARPIRNFSNIFRVLYLYYKYLTSIVKPGKIYSKGGRVMIIDKKANFIRIAESRTNKIIELIHLLGNLSNTSYYEYTPEQINTIFSAIQKELDTQRSQFIIKENKKKKFKL